MKRWENRPHEVAYLLNPAFCGRLLYYAIKEYQKSINHAFPYMLVYLILPIILHKETRELINIRTKMHVWLQKNPEVLVGFPLRAKGLLKITNESVEFLIGCSIISISDNAEISIEKLIPTSKEKIYVDDEVLDCINKSKNIGRWFARSGSIEAIYSMWGVKP